MVLVLDNIRSLYNVGSMFRTADGFGVSKIYLCGITGTPEQNGLKKVALGAELTVPWEHVASTGEALSRLRSEGYTLVGLELAPQAQDLRAFANRLGQGAAAKLALVVGNEVDGILPETQAVLDTIVFIPMRGTKESFNVAVAAGLAMYELLK
jgi:tRNA G18 (ribose-2'-O)-methylase SpoU